MRIVEQVSGLAEGSRMRKYASIPPRVWQADLKAVRGDLEAIAVHYHLTTSGHANMLGLYYLPVAYIAHEIGFSQEGASKGLLTLIDANICSYDFEREIVWVHDMAADQIAPQLSPKDKRVKGIADQLSMLPICKITLGFYSKYRLPFHLYEERNLEDFELALGENSEAPSKQGTGEGEGTGPRNRNRNRNRIIWLWKRKKLSEQAGNNVHTVPSSIFSSRRKEVSYRQASSTESS
jgi:hypothetical protein